MFETFTRHVIQSLWVDIASLSYPLRTLTVDWLTYVTTLLLYEENEEITAQSVQVLNYNVMVVCSLFSADGAHFKLLVWLRISSRMFLTQNIKCNRTISRYICTQYVCNTSLPLQHTEWSATAGSDKNQRNVLSGSIKETEMIWFPCIGCIRIQALWHCRFCDR